VGVGKSMASYVVNDDMAAPPQPEKTWCSQSESHAFESESTGGGSGPPYF
jgi:hypothetical protein